MGYKQGDKFVFEIGSSYSDGDAEYYSLKEIPYMSLSQSALNRLHKYEEEKSRTFDLDKFRQEAFEKGMEEAWKIARLIATHESHGGISATALETAFCSKYHNIFTDFTIQQAKEVIEKFFSEKLNPHSLKVGDVVEKDSARGIVLDFDGAYVSVWTENGCLEGWDIEKVTKTDAHCDLKPILDFVGRRE